LKGFDQKIINLRKSAGFRRVSVRCVVGYLSLVSVLATGLVHAQIQGPGGASQGASSAQTGSSSSGGGNAVGFATSYGGQGGASGAGSALSQSPFSGSVPEGKATSEILPITFKEAIDRALRNNLGVLLGSDNTLNARGQRWHEQIGRAHV
jgi:hypothetical protein